jgi:hypothetical protein
MKNVIQYIESVICQGEGIEPQELHSKCRKRPLVLTRQLIMNFAVHYGCTYDKVGEYFDKDHSTVSYVRQLMKDLCFGDKQFSLKLENYQNDLDKVLYSKKRDEKIAIHFSELDEFKKSKDKKTHLLKMLDPIKKKISASEYELSVLKNDLLSIRQEINKVAI